MLLEPNNKVTWSELKSILNSKGLNLQYVERADLYIIVLIDNNYGIYTNIHKTTPSNSDQQDFEDNYKASSNNNLFNRSIVIGNVDSGSSDSGSPIKIGSTINLNGTSFNDGNRANVQSDNYGSLYINNTGRLQSYSVFTSITIAANATDVFTITGSATKTIKIRNIVITGTNTGNLNALIIILKRSTANSGGTSSNLSEISYDSLNSAATATALSYTANPTTGNLIGNIDGQLLFLPLLGSSNPRTIFERKYGQYGTQPIILRGTSEVFAINMNGATITGTTVLHIHIDWTEE